MERAQQLRDESLPEVKQFNEWVMEVKCQAVREQQKEDKEKRL